MQVSIKSFDVNMQVKSNGIEFEVRSPDGSTRHGDCYLTMTGLVWCPGKTSKKNGTKVNWNDLIAILQSDETRKAAVKAAKQA
ncbi:MAG: hypothetical protein DWQ34_13490 [Planctomycetota bacterium]|nr:MAG: hypothetical protein DWQ34_13490 [Planctomycetota bacterium]REK27363.1 MAG: hypothetical protein DWQ41_08350 [Planctomycetota bacterium]REK36615.1 MAG: hypothetical protein DWQ45_08280 [Planctomycetota bacterium]